MENYWAEVGHYSAVLLLIVGICGTIMGVAGVITAFLVIDEGWPKWAAVALISALAICFTAPLL